ncbi:hypothetical protein K438DRAFT_1935974 [Mycena galopus ATCC 62051]|nr:hypothetical protein K438DRAFT_1935974 [Mycena galopus ATCC 62051]
MYLPRLSISFRVLLTLFRGLMYYDHLLTLDNEINFMWKRAGSPGALWFFAVRYAGFAGNLPVTVFTFYTLAPKVSTAHVVDCDLADLHQWCLIYHTGHQVVLVGTQLIVSVVMIFRIHAIYGHNLRFLMALLAVALPLFAVVVWSTQGQDTVSIDNFPGCHVSASQSTAYHMVAAWEALFLLDAILFLLVVRRTYATWRNAGFDPHMPIHALVLQDGALYFGAIAFANLCNILTFYFAGPILGGSLSTFASSLSVVMMARLILNLHRQIKDDVLTMESCGTEVSNVVFAEWSEEESHVLLEEV